MSNFPKSLKKTTKPSAEEDRLEESLANVTRKPRGLCGKSIEKSLEELTEIEQIDRELRDDNDAPAQNYYYRDVDSFLLDELMKEGEGEEKVDSEQNIEDHRIELSELLYRNIVNSM